MIETLQQVKAQRWELKDWASRFVGDASEPASLLDSIALSCPLVRKGD